MEILLTVTVIVISLSAGIGSELRWQDQAGALARKTLVALLWVLVPFVTFFNLARAHVSLDDGIGLGLAYVAISIAGVTAYLVATRVLKLPRASAGAVITCAMVANTAYLGYPLIVAVLGSDQLSTGVVYDITVSLPVLLIGAFAVGAAFGDKAGEGPRERVIAFFTRNPPLYAAVAALIAPDALAPDFLVDFSRALVLVMLPVGFFAVGTMLAEESEEGAIGFPPPLSKGAATAVAARMLLVPALLLGFSAPLIDLPDPYLLLAVMPVGINSLLVGHVYGLDMRIISQALTWSTGIAVVGALGSLAL
jgi:malate permease and related proteins